MKSYSRKCKYCGARIQLRQMPAGQWVAFEGFDTVHDCSRYRKGGTRAFATPSPRPYRTGQIGPDEFDLDDLEFADVMVPGFGVSPGQTSGGAIESDLAEAVREHRVVLMSYTARYRGRTQQTEREVEPLQMHGDYLNAYCRLRQDFRTFRVSRIHDVRLTSERFKPRPAPSRAQPSGAAPRPVAKQNAGCIWAVIIIGILYLLAMLGG